MRAMAMGLGALVLATAAPVLAADPQVTVENVQASVVVYFNTPSSNVALANWRGTGKGANDWGMQRKITGAQTTQRCVTVLMTPIVIWKGGVGVDNPAKTYGFDWGKVSNIQREDKIIVFHAAHMASDELGQLDFPTAQDAETFEAVMTYLADNCRK